MLEFFKFIFSSGWYVFWFVLIIIIFGAYIVEPICKMIVGIFTSIFHKDGDIKIE